MYREIVDPNFTWDNFSIEEQNGILASKRSNNCLDTSVIESDSLSDIKPIKEAVKEMLIKMKNNL
jgi:hypothetical protein